MSPNTSISFWITGPKWKPTPSPSLVPFTAAGNSPAATQRDRGARRGIRAVGEEEEPAANALHHARPGDDGRLCQLLGARRDRLVRGRRVFRVRVKLRRADQLGEDDGCVLPGSMGRLEP